MRTNKSSKKSSSVTNAEVSNVINNKSHNFFANADFFNNEQQQHVVTIDNSKINKIDVMKMSRIEFFRKLVLMNENFNTIAIYDYRFYNNTNDRSKSHKQDKQDDLLAYSRMRTRKQLADVLKEKAIVAYLCNKHNVKTYLTVNQYIETVK